MQRLAVRVAALGGGGAHGCLKHSDLNGARVAGGGMLHSLTNNGESNRFFGARHCSKQPIITGHPSSFASREALAPCPRGPQRFFSTTRARHAERRRLDTLADDVQHVLVTVRRDVKTELLGAYRRGKATVDHAVLLAFGTEDSRTPDRPDDRTFFQADEDVLRAAMLANGIVRRKTDASDDALVLAADPSVSVSVHYASSPCSGAARLYFTGDESYAGFLALLADDAMGLTLDRNGLWQRIDARGRVETEQRLRQATVARGTGSSTTGQLGSHCTARAERERAAVQCEADSARRMEAQRKAMGLPEGLDLSLDLGPPRRGNEEQALESRESNGYAVPSTDSTHSASHDNGDEPATWKRIVTGGGGEADILDVLGLAWLPPELRFVREPKNKPL